MKSIKNFLSTIDIFGAPYSFRYRDKDKYGTAVGGLFLILLIILILIMGTYYFIPFVKRKNYTIVYYTMNLAATEEINIFESNSNFAVGLVCENSKSQRLNPYNLFKLEVNFIQYEKYRNGSYLKVPKLIRVDTCDYEDFYNKYDKQFDYLGVNNFYCVKNKDFTVQGIYSDKVFSYFEISALAKNNSDDIVQKAENYVYDNDCKLEFIYTDIIIDLDN